MPYSKRSIKAKERFSEFIDNGMSIQISPEQKIQSLLLYDHVKRNKIKDVRFLMGFMRALINFPEDLINYYEDYVKLCEMKLKEGKSTSFHMYDVDFLMVKFNADRSHCEEYAKNYKKNKTTDREGFIKRWGLIEGEKKFKKFKETSLWHDSYMERHGEEKFKLKMREGSLRCVEYYIKRGYNLEEAKSMVSEYQLTNAGVNKEYYYARGYSDEEIDEIFKDLNKRKGYTKEMYIERHGPEKWIERQTKYNIFNIEYLKRKYGDGWKDEYFRRKEMVISRGRKYYEKKLNLSWEEIKEKYTQDELRDDFIKLSLDDRYGKEYVDNYYSEVRKYTELSLVQFGDRIIKYTGEYIGLMSIDHIYPIKLGLENGIDPEIIGHYTNLQELPCLLNSMKSITPGKTIEELINNFKEFEYED